MKIIPGWFLFVEPVSYWFLLVKFGCTLIFLFVKLVRLFFFTWSSFCSRNLLRGDFICRTYFLLIFVRKIIACWFFSSWNLYADFFSLPLKLILLMELFVCLFLFVEFVAYWFLFSKPFPWWSFSSRNLCIDFSNYETEFVHGTCRVIIFVGGTCCLLIFCSSNLLYVCLCSWNLFPLIITLFETLTLNNLLTELTLFMNLLLYWFLFLGHIAHCFFFVGETCFILIYLIVNFYIDFSLGETYLFQGTCCELIFLEEIVICWFLFINLVTYWFFSSWNL